MQKPCKQGIQKKIFFAARSLFYFPQLVYFSRETNAHAAMSVRSFFALFTYALFYHIPHFFTRQEERLCATLDRQTLQRNGKLFSVHDQ
ncbi:hypothetical protein GA0116948_101163 [Chitinophaga costaii]|uniref:Uncharacterized protein n=1 Tax=Chitinophaga costaii TaxID=1335309 RepID=A0A1C3YYC6_9BACT|nr:hypothetical protein GA0116948_101163 [Chitinophaga costaii]